MVFCAAKSEDDANHTRRGENAGAESPHFLEQHQNRGHREQADDDVKHFADDVDLRINLSRLEVVGGVDVVFRQHGLFAEVDGLKQNKRHRHDQEDAGAFGEDAGVFGAADAESAGQK